MLVDLLRNITEGMPGCTVVFYIESRHYFLGQPFQLLTDHSPLHPRRTEDYWTIGTSFVEKEVYVQCID